MQKILLLHPNVKLRMGKSFFLLLLLLGGIELNAQSITAAQWLQVDTSIVLKKDLQSTENLLKEWRTNSLRNADYFDAARCYSNLIKIADLRTEDSLFFRNSACLDSALKTPGLPDALQYCFHLLQTQRLRQFQYKVSSYTRMKYNIKGLDVAYPLMTQGQFDSVIHLHFEQALAAALRIKMNNNYLPLWLIANTEPFLFRPGLYDIVISEQFQYDQHYKNLDYRKLVESAKSREQVRRWLSMPQDAFIEVIDSLGDLKTPLHNKYFIYSDWIFQHAADREVVYYIETMVRKELYSKLQYEIKDADSLYEIYLQKLVHSPYGAVRATGVYQLAGLWHTQSENYVTSYYRYWQTSFPAATSFNEKWRLHNKKALDLYVDNKSVFDSFGLLQTRMLSLEKQIRDTMYTVSVEETNLPGKNLLGQVKYKNASRIYYTLYTVKNKIPRDLREERMIGSKPENLFLAKTGVIELPEPGDYNTHYSFFKLDALPPANYLLKTSPFPQGQEGIRYNQLRFTVSNLAFIKQGTRIFVLNRATGFPEAQLQVKYWKTPDYNDTLHIKPVNVLTAKLSKEGFFTPGIHGQITVAAIAGADTIFTDYTLNGDEEDEEVYTKEDYDNLAAYYLEKISVSVYTDRRLYRPGQLMQFKAICMTQKPETGEKILLTPQNLGKKLYDEVMKQAAADDNVMLYIRDALDNEADTIPFVLNEYGSLSGKFKIPKTAATGEWGFESDIFDFDYGSNVFSVEEYKRPSYKIELVSPEKNHLPGQPFVFKVKARAMTSAPLAGVKVKYTITRNGLLAGDDDNDERTEANYGSVTLADKVGVTGPDGILEIPVHDTLLPRSKQNPDSSSSVNYTINVIATDAGGESHEKDGSYHCTTRPVSFRFPNDNELDLATWPSLKVEILESGLLNTTLPAELKFYRHVRSVDTSRTRELSAMDQWQFPLSQWEAWFPEYKFKESLYEYFPVELVYTTTLLPGDKGMVKLDPALFTAGEYTCVAVCRDSGRIKGTNEGHPYAFNLFDSGKRKLSRPGFSWYEVPYNNVKAGDTVHLYSGNAFDKVYAIYRIAWYSRKNKSTLNQRFEMHSQQAGLEHWTWKVPADAVGKAQVTQTYIYKNQLYNYYSDIQIISQNDDQPEILVEKSRASLSPGSAENFIVSIKARGEKAMAELMTVMYDASLDQIQKHEWDLPETARSYTISHDDGGFYTRDVNSQFESESFRGRDTVSFNSLTYYWWNTMDNDVMGDWNNIPTARGLFGFDNQLRLNFEPDATGAVSIGYGLAGRVSGLNVQSFNSGGYLENVVTIRGIRSITGNSQPLLIVDGVPVDLADLGSINPSLISDVVVLKSAEGMALYGSKGANGVMVVSTKGKVTLPPAKEEPPVPVRKNLNELAFFYPSLYADKDGFYRISFTMPETLTEWKWMMLAHTKNAMFSYLEQTLKTSLPLMVQPNMPRLLYQGDQIVLKTRISNLDTAALKGTVLCKVENAVTGEDITALCITQSSFAFALNATVSGSQSFTLKVPSNMSDPLKITVKARADQFADGEEHIIPVMSPLVLAKQTVSTAISAGKDSLVHPPAIPADAEPYGIAMQVKQRPQAAMLQSLPWLANYSYECAEQSFNKLYAHVMALQLMRKDPDTRLSFENAAKAIDNEKQLAEMPEEVNAISMPWLSLSKKESQLQSQLFNLLDTFRTKEKMVYYLDRLVSLQMTDGGLAWFSGMQSNPFISAYVFAGLGHMQDKYIFLDDAEAREKFLKFSDKLKSYCLLNRYPETELRSPVNKLFRLYAISQWKEARQQTDSVVKEWRTWLQAYAKDAIRKPLYTQAIYIVTALRLFGNQDEAAAPALSLLRSIYERAIRDNEHGVRWKEMGDEDELSNNDEETLGVLAEAFDVSGFYPDEGAAILKWILGERNEESWRTTRGTAAVIRLMEQYGKATGGETAAIEARLDKKVYNLNNDLLSGQSTAFHASGDIFPVMIHNAGKTSATSSVTWYYFTRPDEITGADENLRLQKELTVFDKKAGRMVEVNAQTILHPGDTVYVKLVIQTKKLLRYVYIQDRRAAALEPADQLSGYVNGERVSAYMSVRDAGHQFFAESVPSGMSTLKYNLIVMHEGSFSNGPASIECMYKPDISAWSRAQHITVKE